MVNRINEYNFSLWIATTLAAVCFLIYSQHGHERRRGRGGIGFAGWAPQGVWFTAVILGSLPANYTQSDVRWCTTKKITNSRPPSSWWVFSIKEKHKAGGWMRRGAEESTSSRWVSGKISRAHNRRERAMESFSMINSNFVLAGYHDRIFMNILGRKKTCTPAR